MANILRKIIENDKGEEKLLEFKWLTPKELKNIDLRPASIKDMLVNQDYLLKHNFQKMLKIFYSLIYQKIYLYYY